MLLTFALSCISEEMQEISRNIESKFSELGISKINVLNLSTLSLSTLL